MLIYHQLGGYSQDRPAYLVVDVARGSVLAGKVTIEEILVGLDSMVSRRD
jgi:hypothetical protein